MSGISAFSNNLAAITAVIKTTKTIGGRSMINFTLFAWLGPLSKDEMVGSLSFLALGIALLWLGLRLRKWAQRTLSWPQASGKIVESRVEMQGVADDSTVARIVYSYEVNGTPFKGSRLGGTGMQTPHMLVEKYPVGATVQVFFDPADPASAVLERSTGQGTVVLAFGVIIVAAACVLLLSGG